MFILERCGEGELELPHQEDASAHAQEGGCRVDIVGWLSSCTAKLLSLVWR